MTSPLLDPEPHAPASHQCFIYEGAPSTHLNEVSRTLLQNLQANRRCLYLNSPTMVAGMRWYLSAAGLDLAEQVERGALVLSSDQSHLSGGKFDVEQMLGLLKTAVNQSLADGYAGLWAAGDMTWEFGHESNLDKLLEYERRLEEYMHGNQALSGICLYHKNTLPSHAIDTALATHRSLYVSATLSQLNPRYYLHLAKKA